MVYHPCIARVNTLVVIHNKISSYQLIDSNVAYDSIQFEIRFKNNSNFFFLRLQLSGRWRFKVILVWTIYFLN